MSTSSDNPLSPLARKRIHQRCCKFEEAWKSDQRPLIEEYLDSISGAELLVLFRTLLGAELDSRLERGESPATEEYEQRFSHDKRLLKLINDEFSRRNGDPDEKRPGDMIGHFKIGRVLGKGGFGIVYLAQDSNSHRLVAVKTLRRAGRVDYCRLFEEAECAAKLEHPGVVPIHHVDRDATGTPYIVMKYYEGGSLRDRLKKEGRLRHTDAVEILQSVAEAVQFLHEHGYYHRDLKPENILFDEERKTHVADFGLAIHKDQLHRQISACSGTLPYMAPELFRGEIPDEGTDIWAMGVILYEMLAGTQPFKAESADGLIDRIQRAAPDTFPPNDPPVPLRLVSICLKCLQKNRRQRFLQVADLLIELANRRLLEHWAHETTEDEHYVEPQQAVVQLNRCLSNRNIRICTVTGLAGSGKTAFLAHILKGRADQLLRTISGIFYWSFAAEPQFDRFLESVLRFAGHGAFFEQEHPTDEVLEELITLLNRLPLVVILDSLEVCQQLPSATGFHSRARVQPRSLGGDDRLSRLLAASANFAPGSLVCLVSRFPIHALSDTYSGVVCRFGFNDLRLTDTQGATLLRNCGAVGSDHHDFLIACRQWDGHPLGLRYFAQMTKPTPDGAPLLSNSDLPQQSHDPASLLKEIGRFYEENLPPEHSMLLTMIALFWRPVSVDVVRRLASAVPGFNAVLGSLTENKLSLELRALCQEDMLRRVDTHPSGGAYLCHPALRDHFGRSCRCKGYLADIRQTPDPLEPCDDVDRLAIQLAVVQTHLESGSFVRADDVFRNQLKDGRAFLDADGAIGAGRASVCEFVRDQQRRQLCRDQLSEERLIHYLRMAGVFSLLTGRVEEVKHYHSLILQQGSVTQTLEVLLNHSLVWILTGYPDEGERLANESLVIARQDRDDNGQRHALACRAFAQFLRGDARAAEADFCLATNLSRQLGANVLPGTDGILHAMFLLRVGKTKVAAQIVRRALAQSRSDQVPGNDFAGSAFYFWLYGCIRSRAGYHEEALEYLGKAERAARMQGLFLLLPFVLYTEADVYRQQKAWKEAIACCTSANDISASYCLAFMRIESLILAARIRLERLLDAVEHAAEKTDDCLPVEVTEQYRTIEEQVRDRDTEFGFEYACLTEQTETALVQARSSHYRWQEMDALCLLADIENAAARHYGTAGRLFRNEAESLRKDLLG